MAVRLYLKNKPVGDSQRFVAIPHFKMHTNISKCGPNAWLQPSKPPVQLFPGVLPGVQPLPRPPFTVVELPNMSAPSPRMVCQNARESLSLQQATYAIRDKSPPKIFARSLKGVDYRTRRVMVNANQLHMNLVACGNVLPIIGCPVCRQNS